MIYLISNADCFCGDFGALFKDAVYCIEADKTTHLFFANNYYPLYVNFYEVINNFVNGNGADKNCQFINHENYSAFKGEDIYLFLNFKKICNSCFHFFKFKGKEINLALSQNLVVSVGGEIVLDEPNNNLKFSHYEEVGEFCIIYFLGERNFVVVIKGSSLFFAGFCDEMSVKDSEFYFVTHLHDILNHGKVCHICANAENYLVYLDENDLNLKSEFLPATFLDCVKAQNFKYANNLLSESLKQENAEDIKTFFADFDNFFCLYNGEVITTKKRAIVSAYRFEIENDKISNIIELTC